MTEDINWSGRTAAYEHKFDDWKDKDISSVLPGFSKKWILDAQWTTCPIEVYEEVRDLWYFHELGNDNYILKTSIEDLTFQEDEVPLVSKVVRDQNGNIDRKDLPLITENIKAYAKMHGLKDDEEFWIHWWW